MRSMSFMLLTIRPKRPKYLLSRKSIRHSSLQKTSETESESRSVVSDSLRPRGLYSPWNSPGQNTVVSSLSQGIFPIQRLNPGLLHWRQILYQLSHKGSPRILEWVAYPFSSGSSGLRNQTGVSCIAGGFFTNWAIREAHKTQVNFLIRCLPCFSFPKKTHLTITYKTHVFLKSWIF